MNAQIVACVWLVAVLAAISASLITWPLMRRLSTKTTIARWIPEMAALIYFVVFVPLYFLFLIYLGQFLLDSLSITDKCGLDVACLQKANLLAYLHELASAPSLSMLGLFAILFTIHKNKPDQTVSSRRLGSWLVRASAVFVLLALCTVTVLRVFFISSKI